MRNVPNLHQLEIYDNPLGCVSGIADDVDIDDDALSNGFYETPRCPESCTINTNYDPDNHVCLSCPENTYNDGIGAVECTVVNTITPTTPTPTTTLPDHRGSDGTRTSKCKSGLMWSPEDDKCVNACTHTVLRSKMKQDPSLMSSVERAAFYFDHSSTYGCRYLWGPSYFATRKK